MELKDWCINYKEEITKNKEVPKPLDDIIDAIFLKEMIKYYYSNTWDKTKTWGNK